MARLKIAVRVETLGLGAKAGIVAAGDLGMDGVELDGGSGDTAPENLSRTGRREVMRFVTSRRLQICALNGDIGVSWADRRRADEVAERIQRILELAVDLGTLVVVVPALSASSKGETKGVIAPNVASERLGTTGGFESAEHEAASEVAAELLRDVGKMAANYGRFVAVRTGLNDGATMSAFLDAAGEVVRAAYDPAALLMGGFDPVTAADALGKRIVHVYARDAMGPGSGRARQVPWGRGR